MSFFVRLVISNLLIILFISVNIFAQKNETEVKAKIIAANSKSDKEITRPRVVAQKSSAIGRIPAKEKQKIKSNDLSLEKKTFQLINDKRKENGLEPVIWNDKIAELAREHSQDMAKYSFFSHIGLKGGLVDQRAIDFGIKKWKAVSENIAYNKGFDNPEEFAVERWMLSNGHRMNLLDARWQESGLGIAVTEDGMYFFTQIFLEK